MALKASTCYYSSGAYSPSARKLREFFVPGWRECKELYSARAKLLFDLSQENNKIVLVQSALLMSYWYSNSADVKQSWYWTGISFSIAQSFGLHALAKARPRSQEETLWQNIRLCSRKKEFEESLSGLDYSGATSIIRTNCLDKAHNAAKRARARFEWHNRGPLCLDRRSLGDSVVGRTFHHTTTSASYRHVSDQPKEQGPVRLDSVRCLQIRFDGKYPAASMLKGVMIVTKETILNKVGEMRK
ncbi:uncharacterized protein CC84DRAFT_1174084 [Paraphaeosphaeria sporulosa]|uniref:Xylanolytic transcriptional activator regulatory domain-containing protein n=1 Tax=Paraphaeosphaeria sporulosa TaxID=1460663 RepID=A0A177CM72_9PLEO|nr:uncharacterized protein CC84DRAFT_1174084 [Paraphaeosphaeria sporulosa]OAG08635.1 hypothetical protein CC84DRAFT_1174084 [Paraphaeosphaeria sporulosa]